MKKQIISVLILGCIALASCMPQDKPMSSKIVKGVSFVKSFEKNGKQEFEADPHSLSRSKKDSYYWFVTLKDDYVGKPQMATEVIQMPGKGVFTSVGTDFKLTRSADGKTWTIKDVRSTSKNGKITGNCWTISADDPLGDYTLAVDVEDEF